MHKLENSGAAIVDEPIMNLVAFMKLSPFSVSLLFLVFISLPISIWGYMSGQDSADLSSLSFFENLSWPVAINFIFPLFLYVSLQFYYLLPRLMVSLVDLCEVGASNNLPKNEIYNQITRWHRNKLIPRALIFIVFVFAVVNAGQLLNQGFTGWMTEGVYFSFLSTQGSGFTGLGIFALCIEFVMMYWVLLFFIQNVMLIMAIKLVFHNRAWRVRYEPGHPDRCCGFKLVGDVALRTYIGLTILGVYLIIKIYDKIFIQDVALSDDFKGVIFVSIYLLIAPLLFHFLIFYCHKFMRRERAKLLEPVFLLYGKYIVGIQNISSHKTPEQLINNIVAQEQAITALGKRIPIYPFRFVFSSILTVLAPMFSLILTVGLVLLKNGLLALKAAYLLGAMPG
ncbi:MAG: hypothetical protein HRU29_15480 [Rhizobiales bacterium]|nr:hypothetical protein [Hyphomicrobiales bacterium]NRB15798.1 hypothetical protein [Hyphomicrobiales bacterium]